MRPPFVSGALRARASARGPRAGALPPESAPAPRRRRLALGRGRALPWPPMSDLYAAVAPFPERFNLCSYYLDRNLDEGRGRNVALIAGREKRVLIVLPDRFEFAEVFFGVLRAGAVFAMVNPLLKREEYAYSLAYSKAR